MANKKISSLNSLGATPNVADIIPITDVSDTTGSVNGTTKKVTVTNLMGAAPVQSVAGKTGTVSLSNTDISGLGTAATQDTGTSANNVVRLDGTAKLPAVDGSQLTNLPVSLSKTLTTPTFTGTPPAYTLTSSENGKVVIVNQSATAYITVPQSLGSGFNCTIVQQGVGRVVLQAGTGATVAGYDLGVATIGQYGVIDLVPIATDSYYVTGDTDRAPFLNTYSADFDGTNEHLHFGTSSTNKDVFFGSGDYAFSIWFRGTSTTLDVLAQNISRAGWIYVTNQQLDVRGFTGSNETFSSVVVNNDWNHLVITRVSGTVDIYLNNSSRTGALTITGTSPVTNPSLSNFGFHVLSGYFWLGQMDEISFHIGSGLSSSQVSAMYNSGVPIDISSGYGATHWWRMGDSFSGTTIADQIGSEPLEAANGVDLQSTNVPV